MSTTTETRQALPAGTWNVDPVHSTVGFAVNYIVGTFNGSFSPVDVKLEVSEDGERLTGSAPVAGVKVQDENLEAHLQSPDFFDAERAPRITYESTAVRRTRGSATRSRSTGT
jgi:polyisoprenoid-binding protein YceI